MTMCAADQTTFDLNTMKALGRAHLNADRIDDALQVYARILRAYPEDIEAYLYMGDCFLAEGDVNAALLMYNQAFEHAPDNHEVQRRLRLTRQECMNHWTTQDIPDTGNLPSDGMIPTNPQAIA